MYLDDMIETLTTLRDSHKLMDSARISVNGHELTGISTNGFDLELQVESFGTLARNPDARDINNSSVEHHKRNMDYQRHLTDLKDRVRDRYRDLAARDMEGDYYGEN